MDAGTCPCERGGDEQPPQNRQGLSGMLSGARVEMSQPVQGTEHQPGQPSVPGKQPGLVRCRLHGPGGDEGETARKVPGKSGSAPQSISRGY